jgi:hypothetical protein
MSSEEQFVTDLQSIHDQQLVKGFNNPSRVEEPKIGSVIFKVVGFGVVTMISFNSTKA